MTSLGVFIPEVSRLPAPGVPGTLGEEGVMRPGGVRVGEESIVKRGLCNRAPS